MPEVPSKPKPESRPRHLTGREYGSDAVHEGMPLKAEQRSKAFRTRCAPMMNFLRNFWKRHALQEKGANGAIRLHDGDTLLASIQGDKLLAHTFNVALSHAEFVKRRFGGLPEGAWVGTIQKVENKIVAINSKTFYDNQLPAPPSVQAVARTAFS